MAAKASRAQSTAKDVAPVVDLDEQEAADLTVDEARALTDQIKAASDSLWELVKTAYTRRAWVALGHDSWDAYLEAEFGKARIGLPREERAEVIYSLRDAGLSIRAIASATGKGIGTIHRELEAESEVIEEVEAEFVEDEPAPEPHKVTGRDGRQYNARRERRKREPKPPVAPTTANTPNMLSVARPEPAARGVFDHADNGVGYGDTDFGACVFMESVQWYSAGSYDEITPAQAKILAACLLAAAESAELSMSQEGAA